MVMVLVGAGREEGGSASARLFTFCKEEVMSQISALWLGGACGTLILYGFTSLALDRRLVFSTWIRLALLLMCLLGPLGTLLTVAFLTESLRIVRRERRSGLILSCPAPAEELCGEREL